MESFKMRNLRLCCVTDNIKLSEDKMEFVEKEFRREITDAITDGCRYFLSGITNSMEISFTRIIIEKMQDYNDLILEIALAYPTCLTRRRNNERALLEKCNSVSVHNSEYNSNCYIIRNKNMINFCDRVVTVYDGREQSVSARAVRYARILNRDIRKILI